MSRRRVSGAFPCFGRHVAGAKKDDMIGVERSAPRSREADRVSCDRVPSVVFRNGIAIAPSSFQACAIGHRRRTRDAG